MWTPARPNENDYVVKETQRLAMVVAPRHAHDSEMHFFFNLRVGAPIMTKWTRNNWCKPCPILGEEKCFVINGVHVENQVRPTTAWLMICRKSKKNARGSSYLGQATKGQKLRPRYAATAFVSQRTRGLCIHISDKRTGATESELEFSLRTRVSIRMKQEWIKESIPSWAVGERGREIRFGDVKFKENLESLTFCDAK